MKDKFLKPPLPENESGEIRTVGFEIEFAAEDCVEVANQVRKLFGGQLEKINPHFYKITDSRLGTFSVQLDTQIVHPETLERETIAQVGINQFLNDAKEKLCELLGDIGKVVVPYEVITSPIQVDQLGQLNTLISGLKELGVAGTDEALVYAFGVHINPEAPSQHVSSILNHLRAFLLLSDWLHEVMDIDLARRASPYINTFPRSYAAKILSPDYRPELSQFIDDYLSDNPTRNRELDLLPLFTYLNKGRVQNQLDDSLTSGRPTYHYRLPDCRLNDPDWSLAREWNLWVRVEELADDSKTLQAMSLAYVDHFKQLLPGDWSDEVKKWIKD